MSEVPWVLVTTGAFGVDLRCRRCGGRLVIGHDFPASATHQWDYQRHHAACEPAPAAAEMRRAGAAELPGLEGM